MKNKYIGNGNKGINSSYKRVKPDDRDLFHIPIISINNIQGNFYSHKKKEKNIIYESGDLIYLLRYINILKDEFGKKRILYVDAGDLYNPQNITERLYFNNFLNYFDINKAFLMNNIFDDENFVNNTNHTVLGNNNKNFEIYNIKLINGDIIKIGVIGYTIDINENYQLEKIINDINLNISKLKEKGVNAIILLTNLEIKCIGKNLNLNIYNNFKQLCDEYSTSNKTIFNILKNIASIDAVIASNSNDMEIHHWVNNIPIMSSPFNGKYFNIMYLPFKEQYGKYILINNEIKIEGPIPICGKIFKDTRICDSEILSKSGETINFWFHERKIFKDSYLKIIEKNLNNLTYN